MNQLVAITETGDAVTTSLAIAEGVGNPHKSVIQLIRQNTSDLEEFGPLAFEMRKGEALPQGGFAKATEYAILNEQQSTLLLTYMRNNDVVREFKKRLVRAFFDLHQKQKVPDMANLSRLDILAMAMEAEQGRIALESKLQSVAPKVAFYDQVTKADDSISVAQAAKTMGTGRTRLFAFMRQIGWVTRKNEPYQAKIEQGYMDVKLGSWDHPDHGLQQSVTALVTGKGLAKLQELWERRREIRAV